ncbi:rod shape-determining protein MreC [Kordiimonas aquimaris]|uniref:rod shape-determining protein MreC n=1 Tax=Kordiimonas aquimaris TaxID=707591 RepID=UPI0021D08D87|nr:rod shape-determining protein MreC [Kordiimonas aquimaris]
MRRENISASRARLRRSARGRDAFWLYMIVALVLLFLEMLGPGVPRTIRGYANDLVAPLLIVLDEPIRVAQSGMERLAGVSDIYVENASLRDENDRLRQWREAAQRLLLENERLRDILKVPQREIPPLATARVIGVGGGAFERNVIINAGSGDQVLANLPVVDEEGLVGRTIEVGRMTSRVLLITDFNSRVPVRLERIDEVAVAEGLNEPLLRLRFLAAGVNVRVGDRVVTSGHGGLFPPDLPVAQVASVDNEMILLSPLSSLGSLDFVRVMDYRPLPPELETDSVIEETDREPQQ